MEALSLIYTLVFSSRRFKCEAVPLRETLLIRPGSRYTISNEVLRGSF